MSEEKYPCTVAHIYPDSRIRVSEEQLEIIPVLDPWNNRNTINRKKTGELLCTWPGSRKNILEKKLEMLGRAEERVFFSSFLFNSQTVVEELIKCHERLKGHVYVLSALDKHEERRSRSSTEKIPEKQWERIKEMATAGIEIREFNFCHAKYIIIDNKEMLVTSANATYNSYHDLVELGFWSNQSTEVQKLSQFFKHAWRFASQKRYRSKGQGSLDLSKYEVRPFNIKPKKTNGLIWTYSRPGNNETVAKHINEIINSTRKGQTIDISTWCMDSLESHDIGQNMVEATRRGINVRLIINKRLFNLRRDRYALTWLIENCDPDYFAIQLHKDSHAKLVTNGEQALIWSGNLEPEKGLYEGYEIGWKCNEKWFVENINTFFKALWQTCHSKIISGGQRTTITSDLQEETLRIIIKDFKEPARRSKTSLMEIIDLLEESQVYTRTSQGGDTLIGCGGLCLSLDNYNKLLWVSPKFVATNRDAELKFTKMFFIPLRS